MSKVYATVLLLSIFTSFQTMASEDILLSNFKTKQIVRLKLWYDGLEIAQVDSQQNQGVSTFEVKEELSRVLDKYDN